MTNTTALDFDSELAAAQEIVDSFLSGWTVKADRAANRWGCCHHQTRTLTFSRPLFTANPDRNEFRETLLHEMGHAIAGPGAGHGPRWAAIVRRLGGTPRRGKTAPVAAPARYQGTCGRGCTPTAHRRSKYFGSHVCYRHELLITWTDTVTGLVI